MRKSGFTLAEVLVTLGIIGVVAALTIPALNNNVSKQKIGPSLAKAINTLENANMTILAKNQLTRLDSTSYPDALRSQMNCARETVSNPTYKDIDGSSNTLNGSYYKYTTKDGIVYYIKSDISNQSAPAKYVGKYYVGLIDINGTKAPNTSAKDMFLVRIDASGAVIPVGGYQFNEYTKASGNPLWKTYCTDTTVKLGTENLAGKGSTACAGAIVDNGYKAKYSNYDTTPASSVDPPSSSGGGGSGYGYGYH